jgi:hypothetical protein
MAFAGHGGRRYVPASGEMHARLAALLERMNETMTARRDLLSAILDNVAARLPRNDR